MRPTTIDVGGARLSCITTDKFKSEYISLLFTLPLDSEAVQMNTLLIPVLCRGTERHKSKREINLHLDELYSTSIAVQNHRIGDMQQIGLTAHFPGGRYVGGGGILSDVLETMADLLYRPLLSNGYFCEEFVENEKAVLRDDIRAAINNPRSYAKAGCRKLLCAGEPYALRLDGEEQMLGAVTKETLTEHYKKMMSVAVPTFFYVGSATVSEVERAIRAHFPSFSTEKTAFRALLKAWEGTPLRAEEEMPVSQGKLAIGFRTDLSIKNDAEAKALAVMNEIFGASPASKLFLNVREKQSLCYHCSSTLSLYKGVLFVGAGMTPENREITENAILKEFSDIQRGNVTDTELQAAKRSLDLACRQALDSPGALSAFYGRRALVDIEEPLEKYREAISHVSVRDVVAVANRVRCGAVFFLKGTLSEAEVEE